MSVLRLTLVSAVVLGACTAEQKEPPLAEVLKRATAEEKPVLLDVYAVWCEPCKKLEKEVFPHPEMKAELNSWVSQRYDGEKGEGESVAARYGVNGFPTLIVLSPDGTEIARLSEQEPLALAQRLHTLRSEAILKVPSATELATTTDARLLAAAARRAKGVEQQTLWKRALEADGTGAAGVGAEAALQVLVREMAVRDAEALESLIRRFPASEQAVKAFCALTTVPKDVRPGHEALSTLAESLASAHATGERACGLNDAVYALLALDEKDLALRVAEQMVATCTASAFIDTLAEVHHQLGHRDRAVEIEQRALEANPDDSSLKRNLKRFKAGEREPASPTTYANPLHPPSTNRAD